MLQHVNCYLGHRKPYIILSMFLVDIQLEIVIHLWFISVYKTEFINAFSATMGI